MNKLYHYNNDDYPYPLQNKNMTFIWCFTKKSVN